MVESTDQRNANPGRPAVRRASGPPHSALAVIALILALVPCCPLLPMLGSTLGAIADYRIFTSGGMLRGRRTARSAIFIGIGMTLITSTLMYWMKDSLQSYLKDALGVQTHHAVDPNAPKQGEDSGWLESASGGPNTEDIERFRQDLSDRYGNFQGFTISLIAPKSGFYDVNYSAAGVFDFEKGSHPGHVHFQLAPGSGFMPEVRMTGITIEDAQQGALTCAGAASKAQ
ncbi:MAG TPA: hypothetical protein VG711_11035 [Phycisphaerales bacterium]|nr:hypothetical protein [Phycisphaerales bacterium]